MQPKPGANTARKSRPGASCRAEAKKQVNWERDAPAEGCCLGREPRGVFLCGLEGFSAKRKLSQSKTPHQPVRRPLPGPFQRRCPNFCTKLGSQRLLFKVALGNCGPLPGHNRLRSLNTLSTGRWSPDSVWTGREGGGREERGGWKLAAVQACLSQVTRRGRVLSSASLNVGGERTQHRGGGSLRQLYVAIEAQPPFEQGIRPQNCGGEIWGLESQDV